MPEVGAGRPIGSPADGGPSESRPTESGPTDLGPRDPGFVDGPPTDGGPQAAVALASAVTLGEVVDALFEHTLRRLGGLSLSVWLFDEAAGVIRFSGGAGYVAAALRTVATIPVESDLPAAVVVRTGRPVIYGSQAERVRRWPALADVPTEHEAAVTLRLDARGRRLGCMSIGFPESSFSPAQLEALDAVAEQCAVAVDRALLYEAERRAHDTLEFLAAGTALMVSSLNPTEILQRLVELAVPRLADSCAVFLADGGYLIRQAFAVRGGDVVTTRLADAGRIPVDADLAFCAAFRTGRPQRFDNPVGMALASGLSDPLVEALRSAGVRRGMALPVAAGGETVGCLIVAWREERPETDHDRYGLNSLAARAAVALLNARRYRRQLETANMLTAALLPSELSVPASLDVAARYIPAAGAVAGDWYEALTRPGGEVVFGVGDAAGHGLAAVAAMAELRNAARGLAVAGMTPSAILGHLSALLSATTTSESIATAFYATFDPASGTGLWSLAGHPPPLLAGPDQPPEFLLGPTGVPLGVVDSPGYTDGQLTLGPDAALIAVTDGVVERRGRSLDTGLAELAEVVAAERTRDAATIADRVADEFCAEPADDCCVLVLHYTPA